MALILSAPWVGPAHNNLNERYKTGFRFWCFLLQILLRFCITMHIPVLLCVSGWGDFRSRWKSDRKPCRTRISALRTSWETFVCAFSSSDRAWQHPNMFQTRVGCIHIQFGGFVPPPRTLPALRYLRIQIPHCTLRKKRANHRDQNQASVFGWPSWAQWWRGSYPRCSN